MGEYEIKSFCTVDRGDGHLAKVEGLRDEVGSAWRVRVTSLTAPGGGKALLPTDSRLEIRPALVERGSLILKPPQPVKRERVTG